jgi:hypothetical protein
LRLPALVIDRLCPQSQMLVRAHWHSVPLLVPSISLSVSLVVMYIPSFVSCTAT